MIRDSVTMFGALKIMRLASRGSVQMPVDTLRERPADTGDLRDVVHRGGLHAAQAAEVLDERLAALGADPADLVQHGGGAGFAAPRPVPDHRKAVGLVADLLDQVQPWVRRRQLEA